MTLTTPLATFKNHLDLIYGNTSFQVALIDGNIESNGFILKSDDYSQIYCIGHQFINNRRVRFSSGIGASLPGGMVTGQDYYVVNKTTNYFQVSSSLNGSPITFTNTGSNDANLMLVTEQPLDTALDALNLWIDHEVDYRGSARQSYLPGLATIGTVEDTLMAYTTPKTIIFTPSTASITARYLLFIRGGNLTAGDTTGTLERVQDYVNNFLIEAGQSKGFTIGERKY